MKITGKDFDDFWNAKWKYRNMENAERFRQNICNKINELGDTVLLDEYVCGLRTGKESMRKVITAFYDYLRGKSGGKELESKLDHIVFFDYPFERQLEIAKYLYEPRSVSDISEHFGIDERTVRKDLAELEDGITVMGASVQIKREKKGHSYFYRSTLHPVFLPLNLTEVYALTVYLENVAEKNDLNAKIISNISQRIKSQLSDYAYERLFPDKTRSFDENRYLNDEMLAKQREGIRMYLMKSGQPCKFFWKDNEYIGKIVWTEREYRIRLENGEYLDADLSEVDFIIESLEYR